MHIREAKKEDVFKIMEILDCAKVYLKNENIDQWQNGYPNIEVIENDIENNEAFVLVDENIIGYMSLSYRGEKTYNIIDGKWLSNEAYAVIHRLGIDDNYKGKKLANLFFDYTIKKSSELNINSIRIDTHPDNISMQKWIINNKFEKCGTVRILDNSIRWAYEKLLK